MRNTIRTWQAGIIIAVLLALAIAIPILVVSLPEPSQTTVPATTADVKAAERYLDSQLVDFRRILRDELDASRADLEALQHIMLARSRLDLDAVRAMSKYHATLLSLNMRLISQADSSTAIAAAVAFDEELALIWNRVVAGEMDVQFFEALLRTMAWDAVVKAFQPSLDG